MATAAYEWLVKTFLSATESGLVPDAVLRCGIRYLLSLRAAESTKALEEQMASKMAFVEELKTMPIAINTSDANEQHYEIPTEYYILCLGKHLKYSSCLYNSPKDTLGEAEANMLGMYCQRAELQDGQDILELGCGWGSFSLFAAAAFPNSKVTAVSNSSTQKAFIDKRAADCGLKNLTVITANIVHFETEQQFDRIVSIEMFEHMKNYHELLKRCSTWLKPKGKLFVHIFVHKSNPYHFEVSSEADWMTKYFFSGGTMPSLDLLLYFQEDMKLKKHWYLNGVHYSKTLEAWLVKHDAERSSILSIFDKTYGPKDSFTWFNRWRVFYIACSELFAYNKGNEWGLGHYLFEKP